MLKQDQLVLLPCHEAIGKVIFVNEEKAVIRVEKQEETYDVILTSDGLLPHTSISLVEMLHFKPGETIVIKPESNKNLIMIAEVKEINVIKIDNNSAEVRLKVTDSDGEIYSYPLEKCYKLFTLKKEVDKAFRRNDKFVENV